MTRVKVCCIQSAEEAALAAGAGASFLGLVAAMPSGPGPISDPVIAEIAARVPAGATPVLLTSRTDPEAIVSHVRATGARAVQIVRTVSAEVRRAVRQALPGVPILQVVHVEGKGSLDEALEASEGSDYLLLDSGRPSAAVPELGGTGRVHDWSVSARIVAETPVPVFLAGGLGPRNVARAVAEVAPFGVDVCSGLRGPDGRLDPALLSAFMEAVGAGVSAPRQP
ncbi:MAG: N-(5'-phosphoribosyl)anthranilate isomerase [Gemmatimonadota bacterium]